jgi:hypothetical protein
MTLRIERADFHEFEHKGKKIHRYDIDLLKCTQELHEASMGSSECSPEQAEELYTKIKWRLDHWVSPSRVYDMMVMNLCGVALEEYQQALKKRKERG